MNGARTTFIVRQLPRSAFNSDPVRLTHQIRIDMKEDSFSVQYRKIWDFCRDVMQSLYGLLMNNVTNCEVIWVSWLLISYMSKIILFDICLN